jgi:hypothetical protein
MYDSETKERMKERREIQREIISLSVYVSITLPIGETRMETSEGIVSDSRR